MAIALFATFVNQTPLFGNGAAGLVGRRKTLGKNNRVMDGRGRCCVSDWSSLGSQVRCLRRLKEDGHSPHSILPSLFLFHSHISH